MMLDLGSITLKGSSFFIMILRLFIMSFLIVSFKDVPLIPYFLFMITAKGTLSLNCLYYLSNDLVESSQASKITSTEESLTF